LRIAIRGRSAVTISHAPLHGARRWEGAPRRYLSLLASVLLVRCRSPVAVVQPRAPFLPTAALTVRTRSVGQWWPAFVRNPVFALLEPALPVARGGVSLAHLLRAPPVWEELAPLLCVRVFIQRADGQPLASGVSTVERRLNRLRTATPAKPLLHPTSDWLLISPDGVLAADFCDARDSLAAGHIDQAEYDRFLAGARRKPPTNAALLADESAITLQFRGLLGLSLPPTSDAQVPLFTDPRRPALSRSLTAAVTAGVRAGGRAVKRSGDTMQALQALYDRVANRSGRVLDRLALVHSVQAMTGSRDVTELWEEALLELRDLQLFIHGAFADAVVKMPSAPAQATSLPLVGAGAVAASATILAKRQQLGATPGKGAGPPPPTAKPKPTATPGSSRRSPLGTPRQTPSSSGRRRLGEPRASPPPPLDFGGGGGSAARAAESPARKLTGAALQPDATPQQQHQPCPGRSSPCGRRISVLCGSKPKLCGTCCAGGCALHRTPRHARPQPVFSPGGKLLSSPEEVAEPSMAAREEAAKARRSSGSASPAGRRAATPPPSSSKSKRTVSFAEGADLARSSGSGSRSKRSRSQAKSASRKSARRSARKSDPASVAAGGAGRSSR